VAARGANDDAREAAWQGLVDAGDAEIAVPAPPNNDGPNSRAIVVPVLTR